MEHWAQKCDGAGVDPAQYAKVCLERDELKAAYEAAQMALKALNEKLVSNEAKLQKAIAELHEVKSERDALAGIVAQSLTAYENCEHEHLELPCIDLVEALECEECRLEKRLCCTCDNGSNFELKFVKEET